MAGEGKEVFLGHELQARASGEGFAGIIVAIIIVAHTGASLQLVLTKSGVFGSYKRVTNAIVSTSYKFTTTRIVVDYVALGESFTCSAATIVC